MKTPVEFAKSFGVGHWEALASATEARDRDVRAEAYADALLIFRGLAVDHMTPSMEEALLALEKAITRKTIGS